MSSDREILFAARTVQSELETLLGDEATQVAPQLAQLIADVEAGKADSWDIEDFLAEYEPTRNRMAALLKVQSKDPTRYDPPAGSQQIHNAEEYICPCPECDYIWYRRNAGQEIPQCPTHNVTLVPAPNP